MNYTMEYNINIFSETGNTNVFREICLLPINSYDHEISENFDVWNKIFARRVSRVSSWNFMWRAIHLLVSRRWLFQKLTLSFQNFLPIHTAPKEQGILYTTFKYRKLNLSMGTGKIYTILEGALTTVLTEGMHQFHVFLLE